MSQRVPTLSAKEPAQNEDGNFKMDKCNQFSEARLEIGRSRCPREPLSVYCTLSPASPIPKMKSTSSLPRSPWPSSRESTFSILPASGTGARRGALLRVGRSGGHHPSAGVPRSHASLNKDCVNCQGYTALHVAVRRKDLSMVKFLVQNGVRLNDVLLHAVETGDVPLTEFLVAELSKTDPQCEKRGYPHSATYTADVSPIILAAQMGHWTLIHFFVKRGLEVEAPHTASCLCKTCIKVMRVEGVNASTRNLNTYKAICNPHYMLQVSGDPILDSFLYAQGMAATSHAEEEFRREYDQEIAKLRTFTCALLDQCRTVEETRVLLERPAGLEGRVAHLAFPRVILALQYNEREFVTHGHVQQVLRIEWEGEFKAWNRLTFPVKLVHFLIRFFTLPVVVIWVKLMPQSVMAKHWSSPVNKYMNHFAARLMFVFFVYMQICLDKARTSRGAPHTGVEWLIVIWVMGFVFEEIVHCYTIGASRYFSSMWHWYDITMISLFLLTFIFWIVAWAELLEIRAEESAKLGPLQVSISSMMIEIVRFFFICICIMLAFAFGLTRMYEPYKGMKRTEPDGEEVNRARLSHRSAIP
ncbi:hypothetical protein HPB52_011545 [Rhipicephalus sanguineus]|uniref:Transient receptor ion channel domain-containing protein n=1 Tax=Rhipicephalus sanguineus TaxID=34632 RepID=A0A9D4PRF9_RHISA|nr:hypothetical protein HPB52_011545 [Rhipicephalus sanguineus]